MGVSQVSVAMKMLNATWISAMVQPCAWWIGLTNRVQAYCRLAISTMHNTPSQSWTQRFGVLPAVAYADIWRTSRQSFDVCRFCVMFAFASVLYQQRFTVHVTP